MSRLLDERLAASKNTNNQQTDKELSVYCEGIMQSKGVVTAASICQDAEKLVSLTESIIAATQTLPVMPTVGKQLMQEASTSLQSKSSYKFLSGLNLACGYGAIVKNTIGVDALLTENLSPQHKTLLLEAFKEFQSLSSAGKSMVVEKFPSLPSMVVSEATHKKMVEASVEVLQEAKQVKVDSQILGMIQAKLRPLKNAVKSLNLPTLKVMLSSIDQNVQTMLAGKVPPKATKSFVAELIVFYNAMWEFTTKDLPVILESDPIDAIRDKIASTDKAPVTEAEADAAQAPTVTMPKAGLKELPLGRLLQGEEGEASQGFRAVVFMIIGRLSPEDQGFFAKAKNFLTSTPTPPNLKDVLQRWGGSIQTLARDFLNLTLSQLEGLSKTGMLPTTTVVDTLSKLAANNPAGGTPAAPDAPSPASPAAAVQNLKALVQKDGSSGDPVRAKNYLDGIVQQVLKGLAQPNQPAAAQPYAQNAPPAAPNTFNQVQATPGQG
jgi:hypothetical protein